MHSANKSMPYDQAFDDLLTKVVNLQTDLSEIAGSLGSISVHGAEDLREETVERAAAVAKEGQRLAPGVAIALATGKVVAAGQRREGP